MEYEELANVSFAILSTAEIRYALSKVNITNPSIAVNFGKNNTLHDIRMGAFKNHRCGTCNQSQTKCPSHHGSIELVHPIVNIHFIKTVLKPFLDELCVSCLSTDCKCSVTEDDRPAKKRKVESHRIKVVPSKGRGNDTVERKSVNSSVLKVDFVDSKSGETLSIKELYSICSKTSRKEFFDMFPQQTESLTGIADAAFIHVLPVLPIASRTPNVMNNVWTSSHLTRLYVTILRKNISLSEANFGVSCIVDERINELQQAVNILFDVNSSTVKLSKHIAQNGGLRQRIDGKHGFLRKYLQGKRTNFCARSVASGDPRLRINEIGIPVQTAETLTIPVRINQYNIDVIKYKTPVNRFRYVLKNGDDDQRYDVSVTPACMKSLAVGDIVERKLQNGDVVVVNRQPSLHRGSMLGMYVRIIDTLTFRFNVSSASPMNLDFDGDALNIYVPQDLESRAEIETNMMASSTIVSSQTCKPLIGLVQDALLGAFLLSKDLLTKNDIQALMMECDCASRDPTPSVLKPRMLFAGTCIIELILAELEIEIKYYKQGDFIIRDGVVIQGLLNKSVVGTSENSIIHIVFLAYGDRKAAEFIYRLQLAIIAYLDIVGFSVGLNDCVTMDGNDSGTDYNFEALDDYIFDQQVNHGKLPDEKALCSSLNNLLLAETPPGMDPDNNLLRMIESGAKGSMVNFNQITNAVSQQIDVNGRASARMDHGRRVLPHDVVDDYRLSARGFVKNSFIKGLSPKEFFLHAQASRIGLIDTSQKTSLTGYCQRKLVKSLESLRVEYGPDGESLVKDSITGQIVQFQCGEDGLDGKLLKKL